MACVPAWIRLGYTLLFVTLAPIFARSYGVANFLWFSNLALIGILAAFWLRSRLVLGMTAVAVVLPELVWNLAFWTRLLTGLELGGLVGYMFDPAIPLWARLLSLYHVPLPFFLLWLVWRCGYDRRAIGWQTLTAWVILPLSLLASTPHENINLVYGPLDTDGEPRLPVPVAMLVGMVALPLGVYLPTHRLLGWMERHAVARRAGG